MPASDIAIKFDGWAVVLTDDAAWERYVEAQLLARLPVSPASAFEWGYQEGLRARATAAEGD